MPVLHRLLSWQSLMDFLWLLFLLVVLIHFWKKRQILVAARSWKITKGRIHQLEWAKESNSLWLQVTYTYQLFEQEFLGDCIFLDEDSNRKNNAYTRSIAYRIVMAFKNQEEIDVYYNSDNPMESALDINIPWSLHGIMGFVLFFLVMHLSMVIYHIIR